MPDERDEADYRTRVLLALSLLNQREPNALTCELAVLALSGSTVAELYAYIEDAA